MIYDSANPDVFSASITSVNSLMYCNPSVLLRAEFFSLAKSSLHHENNISKKEDGKDKFFTRFSYNIFNLMYMRAIFGEAEYYLHIIYYTWPRE